MIKEVKWQKGDHKMLSIESSQTILCTKAAIISAYLLLLKMCSCSEANMNTLLKKHNLCVATAIYIQSVGGMPAKGQKRYQNLRFFVYIKQ